jgi:predicted O-linked N-acetylglucosamine transferase (SPINDLY family)
VDGGDIATRNLRAAATAQGVEGSRLAFAPRVPLAEHLERIQAADLALDTWPYNGHATTSDTLAAGVPVVALLGATFAGRVAASLLRAVAMPELIAASVEGYEALAVGLASEPDRLAEARARLGRQRETQPLFDIARFTRDFEAALEAIVRG